MSRAVGNESIDQNMILSVRNLNTLTYLVMNARALQRSRDLNGSLLTRRPAGLGGSDAEETGLRSSSSAII